MNLTFTGHGALILGGTCELAVHLAKKMLESGLHPILTFRDEAGLDRVTSRLEPWTGRYDTIYIDLDQPESVDIAFSKTEKEVDYLVDFAHDHLESLIGFANGKKVERYFASNISARARLLKQAAREFLKKGCGRLVYVSSAAVERANPGQGFYAASKLASEALYRNLGLELGDHGITTVSLRLGYVDAGRGKAYLARPERKKESASRGGTPALTTETVVETILFYLSDSAAGFNATEVRIDKGYGAAKREML